MLRIIRNRQINADNFFDEKFIGNNSDFLNAEDFLTSRVAIDFSRNTMYKDFISRPKF
jgi:hypothetical protein